MSYHPTVAVYDSASMGMDDIILVDVLANDQGTNLSIVSINSCSGFGIPSINSNKIEYSSTTEDSGTTVIIHYTITGDGGDDNGTLDIEVL